ncbi:MAG: hypothetical protein ACKOU7_05785 [Ferruginibacter sp.]
MRSAFLLSLVLLFSRSMQAQHCPFDGSHLIAVHVVDKQGKTLTNSKIPFYLLEVDNPSADSCTYSAGLIKKQLLNTKEFIANCDEKFGRNGYNTRLKNRLTNAGVFAKANMMISINQGENTCMLIGKTETVYANYIYRQRKFVIAFTIDGKEIRTPLAPEFIYALCTNNKELKNFKPLTIQL